MKEEYNVQVVSNLWWFDLIFQLTMVWKQHAFSRNCTSVVDVSLASNMQYDSMLLDSGGKVTGQKWLVFHLTGLDSCFSFSCGLGLLTYLVLTAYISADAAAAKSLQSCLTLCDPIDGSSPGFPVPGILQARTLEWVAVSFSSAWKWKVKVKLLSCVQLLVTPWTAAYQALPSMGFSRQEYWSGKCC